jgi:hypothetical protein
MNDQRDPRDRPADNESDSAKPGSASTRLVPRPSEVHPLNAVTETPPPAEIMDESSDPELFEVPAVERPSTEPPSRSSAPPERVSLVPPSRLSTSLNAGAGTPMGTGARTNRRPSIPTATASTPPELEVTEPALPVESISVDAPSAPPSAHRPQASPLTSKPPSSRLAPSPGALTARASTPAASHVPGAVLRPSSPSRANSMPPASLRTKGLRPNNLPPIQDKIALVHEQPMTCESNTTLEVHDFRDRMLTRAHSILAHADSLTDATKKASQYVVASEMYAMLGLPQTARLLAERAAKLGNHLGHRQIRQLAHATGDDKAASASFVSEVASAPNSELRRHVATAATHFERWVRQDALSATRNSDLLQRLVPQDPGPQLLKLARQLGQNNKPPQNLTWHPESHQRLSSANVSLQKLRGDLQRISDDCKDPVATFLEVRAALERRDRVAAAKGLLNLHKQPGCERSALWLAAALLSPVAATRDKAVELLTGLESEQTSKPLRSILAARAVEAGNVALLDKVVGADDELEPGDRAFSTADQLAFITLGLRAKSLETQVHAADNENTRPLFRALARTNDALHLLSTNKPDAADADGLAATPNQSRTGPDAVVDCLKELDVAYERADKGAIASVLLRLEGLDSAEHLAFAAATITAFVTPTTEQEQWLNKALHSPVCGEAALLNLLPSSSSESAPQLIETVANGVTSADHKAFLLAHAALVSTIPREQTRLTLAAFASDPGHPLVEAVTQRYAPPAKLSTKDDGQTRPTDPPNSRSPVSQQLVNIFNAQSVSSRPPYDRALALLRQALRSPFGATRDKLLAHAWELFPEDVTLLDLVEDSGIHSTPARAHAREVLLKHVHGSESQVALRTEAAIFYELSGQFSDAARVSQSVASNDDTWQWCFQRNAPGTEFAAALRKRVVERASTTGNQTERASGWMHAARLAADAGDWPAERSAIDNSIRLDPNNFEGLLAAETLAYKDGEAERIAEVETLLTEAFPAPDNLGHARFAVRFLQAQGGSSAGYTLLLECAESGAPSLDVARRLSYLAPRMGDDEMAYTMVQHLLPSAANDHDRALLRLLSANLALKLSRTKQALSDVDQALEASSTYVPALLLRAQLLASQELHSRTAEAYERLGACARSAALQGQAFKCAAQELLKESSGPTLQTAQDNFATGAQLTRTSVADITRLQLNLERAVALLPDDVWVFETLIQTYTAQKLQEPLFALFSQKLAAADAEQRRVLALRFGQACHELGADERALQLANEVLTATPEDEEALKLLARVARTDAEREKTLLQLVRVASGSAAQAAAYKQLGNFYRTTSPQALRATKSFQEVLKRDPTDSEALRALVEIQIDNNDAAGAEQTLTTYSESVKTTYAQHLVAVLRAVIAGARDPEAGSTILEQLLEQRPVDELALRELATLYVRSGKSSNLARLIERTRAFAMQQVPVGDQLIDSLKCVALLSQATGDTSALALVKATFNLYHGVDAGLDARGSRALSKSLDELLAPAPLTASVRNFLAQTADLWSPTSEVSEDAKVTDKRIRAAFEMKARAASLPLPELYISEKDPYSCTVWHQPTRIVLGAMWVREAPQGVLDFLAWRCLKVLQAGVGAFAHLSNRDAQKRIDALLRRYVDTQDVLLSADEQLNAEVLPPVDRESPQHATLEVLATRVLEQLVQSDLDFGTALKTWVNRSALLATGEPRSGLQSIALTNGELITSTGDAVAFAARNAEAQHLLSSLLDAGVSEAHHSIH